MKYLPDGISLKAALAAFFAVATVFAVSLVALLSFHNSRQAVDDVSRQLRGEIAGHINEHVQDYLTFPLLINQNNARAIGLEMGDIADQETLAARFSEQIDLFPMITSISFGNTLGGLANSGREPLDDSRYVIVTDRFQSGTFRKIALDSDGRQGLELATIPDFDARTRPWYVRAREEDGPVYSDIYIIFTGQDMALAVSGPVYDRKDTFLGVVSVDLFLSHLSQYLQGLSIGKTGQAFIMERSGKLVACSKSPVLLVDEDPSLSSRVQGVESEDPVVRGAVRALLDRFDDLESIKGQHFFDYHVQGQKHLLQATSLRVEPGIDWLVAVAMPEADFMAGIAAQNRITILLTLGVLALVLLVGILMARGITRPISLLDDASRNLTSGLHPGKIAEQSWFVEVRNLTRSFNQMSGKLSGSIQALNDELEQRRQAEAALRESQTKLQAITDSAQEAIIMMGPDGEITYWNPMAESIFGYSAEEVTGKDLHHLLAPQRFHEAYRNSFPAFQKSGQGSAVGKTIELGAITRNGMEIPIAMSLSAVSLRGHWHAVGIVRDISQQKMADQKLIQAKEQAEAANIAKSQFLANMSHELRTPFNGIMGMMQLLQTTPLNHEQHEFVALAIESSQRFTRLLSDILDLSSIQAGKMLICPARFDPAELLESITGLFTAAVREKGVALECSMDPEVPERVVGDAVRVKQILFNLVGNALKFTEQGSVQVRLSALSAAKGGDARIMFSTSDTGIGIPDDKLDGLFMPFVQVNGSYSREYQGAGLGLVIVRRLVELMEGNIHVESVVGQGTTVHVVLPFALPERDVSKTDHAAPAPGEAKKHLNILLAEDDSLNQIFMKTLLKKLGHTVTLARDGQEAVDMFQEQEFDCILMDIQMPVMTGVEATRQIRGQEEERRGYEERRGDGAKGREGDEERGGDLDPGSRTADIRPRTSRIPIIAVTAHTQPGDREKFLAAGMDDYLGKPVSMNGLKKILEKVQIGRKQ